jgi:glycine cleavage system aminomethyltransferase T
VKQKLVGIEIEGEPQSIEPADPRLAYKDGKQVGRVTITIWSPRLERNIGYVWVPIELSDPGNVLDVETDDGTVKGRTASLPFVAPKKIVPSS